MIIETRNKSYFIHKFTSLVKTIRHQPNPKITRIPSLTNSPFTRSIKMSNSFIRVIFLRAITLGVIFVEGFRGFGGRAFLVLIYHFEGTRVMSNTMSMLIVENDLPFYSQLLSSFP